MNPDWFGFFMFWLAFNLGLMTGFCFWKMGK